eukprot:CAMPEP_0204631390 /NCGR_PEP_ID=MMETSP0717-20131115/22587_1 /ASSEMBLY_ACC=CAM_ASM_000666 /TAXON_ID=230516 /ORGANISM="Chaetoceros curvisetus" /LENGTH=45 /DNA_ID= /DNA_START= /DNA_END= /DNA_ORIENTATION=
MRHSPEAVGRALDAPQPMRWWKQGEKDRANAEQMEESEWTEPIVE